MSGPPFSLTHTKKGSNQRIAEDVYRFINGGSGGSNIAYGIYDFSILLISTVSSLVSFAIAQWGLSRSFTLPDTNIVLPGFLYSCMLGAIHSVQYGTRGSPSQIIVNAHCIPRCHA